MWYAAGADGWDRAKPSFPTLLNHEVAVNRIANGVGAGRTDVQALRWGVFLGIALALRLPAAVSAQTPLPSPPAAHAAASSSSAPSSRTPVPVTKAAGTPTAPSAPPLAPAGRNVPGDAYWTNPVAGMGDLASLPAGPSSPEDVLADAVLKQDANPSGIPPLRAQQIQEAAAAYGAQAGADARAKDINRIVQERAARYDRAFNFAALMLEPGFLPPVISEGRDAYNQPSADEVRAADRLYRIEFPARLVSVPPSWRDYLPMDLSGVERPSAAVLPQNREEKNLWNHWAAEGWKRGVLLANNTFEANLARLDRDFHGMIRFKALYEQGVVSKPLLAHSTLGVTGGGDEMAVNDRISRITEKAQLDPAQARWRRSEPVTAARDLPAKGATQAPPGESDR